MIKIKKLGKGTKKDPFRPDTSGLFNTNWSILQENKKDYDVQINFVDAEKLKEMIDYAKGKGWITSSIEEVENVKNN